MRSVVVVQARTGSTRLPNKVLVEIAGRPMISHVLDRASRITGIDEVVAAVPDLASDDELTATVGALGFRVVRGSADDVLARYVAAVEATSAEVVVRVTADCPLLSPTVASEVVAAHGEAGVDYASNTLERTFPRGLDTEAMSADVLRTAASEATDAADREHVTPFIWRHPEQFILRSVRSASDRSHLRWTVDVLEDLALVRAIYDELGTPVFDTDEIMALLDRRPDLVRLNESIVQKAID